jgi:hypothetical protein
VERELAESAASSKRIDDGGRDKAERGKPAYRPDQQIHHAAVFLVVSDGASYEGLSRTGQCQKK